MAFNACKFIHVMFSQSVRDSFSRVNGSCETSRTAGASEQHVRLITVHCNALYCTAVHCFVLKFTELYCNALHCNTFQPLYTFNRI